MRDMLFFFFFSSRRRHTRCYRDWSSDVCSSDLVALWATFDCYGTLVDWNAGIRAVIGDELLARYHEIEPQVQSESPSLSYRDVMREVLRRIGFTDVDALGRSLPDWPVFPEVPDALSRAREQGWKLAILSNTDRDFIEASMTKKIGRASCRER